MFVPLEQANAVAKHLLEVAEERQVRLAESVEELCESREYLSFPKIPSARIRALRQNQSIILGDACMPSAA